MSDDWLSNLKVGDVVIVHGSGLHGDSIDKVAKLTKTQIVLERGSRFRRSDGCQPGDGYHMGHLGKPSKERIDGIRREMMARRIHNIKHADLVRLPVETLAWFIEQVNEAKEPDDATE